MHVCSILCTPGTGCSPAGGDRSPLEAAAVSSLTLLSCSLLLFSLPLYGAEATAQAAAVVVSTFTPPPWLAAAPLVQYLSRGGYRPALHTGSSFPPLSTANAGLQSSLYRPDSFTQLPHDAAEGLGFLSLSFSFLFLSHSLPLPLPLVLTYLLTYLPSFCSKLLLLLHACMRVQAGGDRKGIRQLSSYRGGKISSSSSLFLLKLLSLLRRGLRGIISLTFMFSSSCRAS